MWSYCLTVIYPASVIHLCPRLRDYCKKKKKKKKYISQYINTGTFPFIVNIGIATKNHDWSGSNNNFCSNTSYKQEELFLQQQYLSQLGVDE